MSAAQIRRDKLPNLTAPRWAIWSTQQLAGAVSVFSIKPIKKHGAGNDT